MKVDTYKYGKLITGEEIDLIEIHSDEINVKIINYGCRLIEINTPDRYGKLENIILKYNNLNRYENDEFYLGAILGRCANRIKNGELDINDIVYELTKNENGNHLHGGFEGFDKKIWGYEISENSDSVSVVFNYLSKDEEEGYPGNLDCSVEYKLMESGLTIELEAWSDKATAVNMSIHPYFNLHGNISHNILDHEYIIASDIILDVDGQGILTNQLINIRDTATDLSTKTNLFGKVNSNFPALLTRGGFDHSYLFDKDNSKKKVVIHDPISGRLLELNSNTNLIHFYSGNFLNKSRFKERSFQKYAGFALEPQYYSELNGDLIPYVILRPEEKFKNHVEMKFGNE